MRTIQEVKFVFTPNEKLEQKQKTCILKMQKSFMDLATDILEYAPDCPDRISAIRKLLECKMMVTHSITHGVDLVRPNPANSKATINQASAT